MQLQIKVTPKAKENSIKKISNKEYHIRTTAAPDKNKANKSVIKLLSKELSIPKSRLEIIQGVTSRQKTIKIN